MLQIPALQEAGAEIAAYDPAAMEPAKELLERVNWKDNAYAVAEGADAVVIITEWNEFRRPDFERIKETSPTRNVLGG